MALYLRNDCNLYWINNSYTLLLENATVTNYICDNIWLAFSQDKPYYVVENELYDDFPIVHNILMHKNTEHKIIYNHYFPEFKAAIMILQRHYSWIVIRIVETSTFAYSIEEFDYQLYDLIYDGHDSIFFAVIDRDHMLRLYESTLTECKPIDEPEEIHNATLIPTQSACLIDINREIYAGIPLEKQFTYVSCADLESGDKLFTTEDGVQYVNTHRISYSQVKSARKV